ncbi:MAG: hypothetical protein ACI9MR_002794 [Myxococcota bacterium]|jgi:hypothetical protein
MVTRLLVLATLALLTAGCGSSLDLTTPLGPVQAVFDAARDDDPGNLTKLCDPEGEHDGDTRALCQAHPDDRKAWSQFRQWFSSARVSGRPRVEADKGEVDFVFGPQTNRAETMQVVRRGDAWYLTSF